MWVSVVDELVSAIVAAWPWVNSKTGPGKSRSPLKPRVKPVALAANPHTETAPAAVGTDTAAPSPAKARTAPLPVGNTVKARVAVPGTCVVVVVLLLVLLEVVELALLDDVVDAVEDVDDDELSVELLLLDVLLELLVLELLVLELLFVELLLELVVLELTRLVELVLGLVLLELLLTRLVDELLVELVVPRVVLELPTEVVVTPGTVVDVVDVGKSVDDVVDVVETILVDVVDVVGDPGLLAGAGAGAEESSPPHAVSATLANAPIGVKRASSQTPRSTARRALISASGVSSSMAAVAMTSASRVIICNSQLVFILLPS